MKGLSEYLDQHMLDGTVMIRNVWNHASDSTILRCWLKAHILSESVQAVFKSLHARVKKMSDPVDVQKTSKMMQRLQMEVMSSSPLLVQT